MQLLSYGISNHKFKSLTALLLDDFVLVVTEITGSLAPCNNNVLDKDLKSFPKDCTAHRPLGLVVKDVPIGAAGLAFHS